MDVATSRNPGLAWRRYRTACPECDLVVSLGPLRGGQKARCPRCHFLLAAPRTHGRDRAMAFAITGTILLAVANAFPFLELHSSGIEQVMTLPGSIVELLAEGNFALALMVLSPILLIPCLLMLLMIAVLTALERGHAGVWLVYAGRLLFGMNVWSMAEVFIIGTVVSLVKITSLAHVVVGISFWAYAGFALCYTAALASLDRFQLWRDIEECVS